MKSIHKNKMMTLVLPTILSLTLMTGCTANGTSTLAAAAVSGTAGEAADLKDNTKTSFASSVTAEFDSDDENTDWDIAKAAAITLNADSITFDGKGAAVDGRTITITSAGTYCISGTIKDGQIIIDAKDQIVRLVLNGADITCADSAPIYIMDAQKTVIILADGTQNKVTDASEYILTDKEAKEPDAAIFSKSDLTINGTGSLSVDGNYKHGINSKDDLKILGGTITVDAVKDGIRGKDCIAVKTASVTVTAGSDGMQSNNSDDTSKGYIYIESGTLTLTAGNDGIQAETSMLISGGDITVTTGGGSANAVSKAGSGNDMWSQPRNADTVTTETAATDTPSADTAAKATADDSSSDSMKGLKAGIDITINDGTLAINSADDTVHSGSSIEINGGNLTLDAGDDGIHSDAALLVSGGTITVTKSYEGLESAQITVNDGNLYITSSDDGFNASSGSTASSTDGNQMQNGMSADENAALYINGGYVVVDASGDGLDSNGSVYMTSGTVLVSGPTDNGNGPLDYAGSFQMTGGILVAAGSSGMAQAPDATSTQNAVMINLDASQAAGTIFHIESEDGTDILTYAPVKQYDSIVLCSPALTTGSTYKVYCGGTSTGTVTDSLYTGGTYTPGTESTGFTISGIVTTVGTVSNMMGGGGMAGGGKTGGGATPDGGGNPGKTMPDMNGVTPGADGAPVMPDGVTPGAGGRPDMQSGATPVPSV